MRLDSLAETPLSRGGVYSLRLDRVKFNVGGVCSPADGTVLFAEATGRTSAFRSRPLRMEVDRLAGCVWERPCVFLLDSPRPLG